MEPPPPKGLKTHAVHRCRQWIPADTRTHHRVASTQRHCDSDKHRCSSCRTSLLRRGRHSPDRATPSRTHNHLQWSRHVCVFRPVTHKTTKNKHFFSGTNVSERTSSSKVSCLQCRCRAKCSWEARTAAPHTLHRPSFHGSDSALPHKFRAQSSRQAYTAARAHTAQMIPGARSDTSPDADPSCCYCRSTSTIVDLIWKICLFTIIVITILVHPLPTHSYTIIPYNCIYVYTNIHLSNKLDNVNSMYCFLCALIIFLYKSIRSQNVIF